MGDAARARAQAIGNELQGQLGQAWAQTRSAREQRRLIEQTLLPQAQANFESALASYRVGDVDFGTLFLIGGIAFTNEPIAWRSSSVNLLQPAR